MIDVDTTEKLVTSACCNIGCLHDPANVQQTSSKLPANIQLHYNIWQQTSGKRSALARVF